jgi:hypothetical protein
MPRSSRVGSETTFTLEFFVVTGTVDTVGSASVVRSMVLALAVLYG